MRYWFLFLGLLLLSITPVFALQAIVADTHHSSGGGSFTGVGDTLAGAKGHWGSIAYNAASRGLKMYNLCNVADVACADVFSDATTGLVSSTQVIGGVTCGTTVGVNVCTIKNAYSDDGGVFCGGSCDMLQATIANRPTFLPNANGSIPGITCTAAANQSMEVAAGTMTVPLTLLAAISSPSDPGTFGVIISGTGLSLYLSSGSIPNLNAGSTLAGSAISNNTFYAMIGTSDASGNGTLGMNGSTVTGSIGTASGSTMRLCSDGGYAFNGTILESAIYQIDGTSNIGSLTTTMRATGGY